MNARRRSLLADIGGTHARFSVLGPEGPPSTPVVLRASRFADFRSALDAFLDGEGAGRDFSAAAVCVAGPVTEKGVTLTNSGWRLSRETLREATGAEDARIVNDFTAVALALTELGEADLRKLGGDAAERGAAKAVLGPGTGLGVSGLVPDGCGGYAPLAGEGGHVDLAPAGAREMAVLERLAERFGHVSAERVLSGPGLQNLFTAVSDDGRGEAPAPKDIAAMAKAGSSAAAAEAVALFTGWLGAVAGNLALTLGARGGVYIGGGVVPAWGEDFDAASFRARFEAKGRFRDYMRGIPTWVITHPHPAFVGLAALAR